MLLMPCYFFTVKVNVRTIAGLFNNSQRCISGDRFNWLFEAFVSKLVCVLWPCSGGPVGLEEHWFKSLQFGVLKAELHIAVPGLRVNQTREEI